MIGEAVTRLGPEAADPDWSGRARLRDVLAHRYDAIDDGRLWRVIKDEIPRPEATTRAALATIANART